MRCFCISCCGRCRWMQLSGPVFFVLSVELFVVLVSQSLTYGQVADTRSSNSSGDLRDARPLVVSGGVALQQTYFHSITDSLQNHQWGYVASGNFQTTIYGLIDLPVSFYLSRNTHSFSHPEMNRLGASPSYKALTLHAGYRMLRFSDYSLHGVQFLGLGLSYEPETSWWGGTVFYGKLQPAYASVYGNDETHYDRYGYGSKIRLGREKHQVALILFRAEDDLQSVKSAPDMSDTLLFELPKENFIAGLEGEHRIGDRLSLRYDYCLSLFSPDIRSPESPVYSYTYANNMAAFFTPRLGSSYAHAFSLQGRYAWDHGNAGIRYRQIDPDYKSLGTAYQQNDMREITMEGAGQSKNRLWNLFTRLGVQENNLGNDYLLTSRRLIGSVGLQYAPGQWSFHADHANYNTSTNPSSIAVRDTARYVQISKNSNFSAHYRRQGTLRSSLQYRFAYQTVDMLNENATQLQTQGNRISNHLLAYQLQAEALAMNVMPSFHQMQYRLNDTIENQSYTPSLRVSGNLFEQRMQWQLHYNYRMQYANKKLHEKASQWQVSIVFRHTSGHTLQLRFAYTLRRVMQGDAREEVRAGIQYAYRF